jgi:hypothetical protein
VEFEAVKGSEFNNMASPVGVWNIDSSMAAGPNLATVGKRSSNPRRIGEETTGIARNDETLPHNWGRVNSRYTGLANLL